MLAMKIPPVGAKLLIEIAFLAVLPGVSLANTSDEVKAAAEKWLSQERIKIDFKSAATGWAGVFETNLKGRTTQFIGSDDRFCFGSPVPTSIALTDDELVFTFDFKQGCTKIQYRFNPVTGAGKVLAGAEGSDKWTPTQSQVSLRK